MSPYYSQTFPVIMSWIRPFNLSLAIQEYFKLAQATTPSLLFLRVLPIHACVHFSKVKDDVQHHVKLLALQTSRKSFSIPEARSCPENDRRINEAGYMRTFQQLLVISTPSGPLTTNNDLVETRPMGFCFVHFNDVLVAFSTEFGTLWMWIMQNFCSSRWNF